MYFAYMCLMQQMHEVSSEVRRELSYAPGMEVETIVGTEVKFGELWKSSQCSQSPSHFFSTEEILKELGM